MRVGSDNGSGSVSVGHLALIEGGSLDVGHSGGDGEVTIADEGVVDFGEINIGRGGYGTVNVTNGRLAAFNLTVGSIEGEGHLTIGGDGTVLVESLGGGTGSLFVGSGGQGTLEVQGGTLSVSRNLVIGAPAPSPVQGLSAPGAGSGSANDILPSDGTLRIDGGTVNIGGLLVVGNAEATGTLEIADGTLSVSEVIHVGSDVSLGGEEAALTVPGGGGPRALLSPAGTVTLSGGTVTTSGLAVGGLGNSGAVFINGGSLNAAEFVDVGFAEGRGSLTVANGSLSTGYLSVGSDGGSGFLTLTDNSASVATSTLSVGADGEGTVTVFAGTLSIAANLELGSGSGSGSGSLAVSGGLVTVSGSLLIGMDGGIGEFTLAGGALTAGEIMLGHDSSYSSGQLNLLGGVLTTSRITAGPGEAQLSLNGGTLVATADEPGFVASFLPGQVQLGQDGVTVDSNSHDIGITSVLEGIGGLIKSGLGSLALGGSNTYTGMTTVSQGTLRVTGSIAASSLTQVNAGGTLTGTGTVGATLLNGGTLAPGNGTLGALTVTGGFTATSGTFAFSLASPFTSQLVVSGDGFSLIGNGTGAVNVSLLDLDGSVALGRYTLISVVGTNIASANWSLAAFTLGSAGGLPPAYLQLGENGLDLELMLVPEPAAFAALLGLAGLGLALARRRSRR